jgi:hypothetical protein
MTCRWSLSRPPGAHPRHCDVGGAILNAARRKNVRVERCCSIPIKDPEGHLVTSFVRASVKAACMLPASAARRRSNRAEVRALQAGSHSCHVIPGQAALLLVGRHLLPRPSGGNNGANKSWGK